MITRVGRDGTPLPRSRVVTDQGHAATREPRDPKMTRVTEIH